MTPPIVVFKTLPPEEQFAEYSENDDKGFVSILPIDFRKKRCQTV
jgi:hypothetical protein